MANNKISALYHTLFQSRGGQRDEAWIRSVMETVQEQNDEAYEMETIDHYFQHPQFVEQRIIRYVLAMTNIELDMGYISLYAGQMNASAIKAENDKVAFADELLMYTALSYFLTVFSHAYDHREQNTKGLTIKMVTQQFEQCIRHQNYDTLLTL